MSVTVERVTNEAIRGEVVGLRDRLDLIWANHEREHEQHEAAHAREHEFAQKAIDTASLLARENKSDANEWRAAMDDRERTFATKTDIGNIAMTLDDLKRSEIKRSETERLEKEQANKDREEQNDRLRSSQWRVGLIVGFFVTAGAVLVNLVIRLVST